MVVGHFLHTRHARMSRDGSRVGIFSYAANTTEREALLEIYQWQDEDEDAEQEEKEWVQLGNTLNFGNRPIVFRMSGDGNRLLCGVRGEFARVYQYDVTNEIWEPLGQDFLPPELDLASGRPRFPHSLDISATGHRIVLTYAPEVYYLGSALGFDDLFGYGRVWIYEYNDTDEWVLLGMEPLKDETSPWFGGMVTFSDDGSRVAIKRGEELIHDEFDKQISSGFRVYQQADPSSIWQSIGTNSLAAVGHADEADLSLNGSFMVLGTSCRNYDQYVLNICLGEIGTARVLRYNQADDAWERVGRELMGQAAGDIFGGQVSISEDGSRLAVSESEFNNRKGSVRTFVYDATSMEWKQDAGLEGVSNSSARLNFGSYCEISSDSSRMLVIAGGESYARVYARNVSLVDSPWSTTPQPSEMPTQNPSEMQTQDRTSDTSDAKQMLEQGISVVLVFTAILLYF